MRPTDRTTSRNQFFLETLKKSDPDILVLTETNSIIDPGSEYDSRSTKELPKQFEGFSYSNGENRATIFSKFSFGKDFKTYDDYTSVCSEILTPFGPLTFYATIIGVTGGKDARFAYDFEKQKADINKLKGNLCVIGDFNISFSGYPYPSREKIIQAREFFEIQEIQILTEGLSDCPDHIAISKAFMKNCNFQLFQGDLNKKQSDHTLITINLSH